MGRLAGAFLPLQQPDAAFHGNMDAVSRMLLRVGARGRAWSFFMGRLPHSEASRVFPGRLFMPFAG
jgi:hypothetical protein